MADSAPEHEPAVTGEATLGNGRFVALKNLAWSDGHGVQRHWESAERIDNRGAVLVIARLLPSNRMVVIRQYRPPAREYVYEFPAGLMDADESPEQAARRELREETGYNALDVRVHPSAYTTPGLSNESVFMAFARIDENAPENKTPKTEFDPSESIETLLVPLDELGEFHRRETAKGRAFDSKLATFILTLETFGETFGKTFGSR